MEIKKEVEEVTTLIIKLNKEEKMILSLMMQNPRHDHEDRIERSVRETFFHALNPPVPVR